ARKGAAWRVADAPDDAYFDGQIAAAAIAELAERRDQAAPFFLAVGFWKPHLPFNAPRKYWDLYDRDALAALPTPPFPDGAPTVAHHPGRELRTYAGIPAEGPLPDD